MGGPSYEVELDDGEDIFPSSPAPQPNPSDCYQQPHVPIQKIHIDFLEEWQVDYLHKLLPYTAYEKGYVVAGGCLRNLFRGEKDQEVIKDADLFAIGEEFRNHHKSDSIAMEMGWVPEDQPAMSQGVVHARAVQAAEAARRGAVKDYKIKGNPYPLQIIYPSKPYTVEELLNRFDIGAAQIAFDGEHVYHSPSAPDQIKTKTLFIHHFQKPERTLRRLARYKTYGYDVDHAISQVCNLMQAYPKHPHNLEYIL